jgi:hypothetical protein
MPVNSLRNARVKGPPVGLESPHRRLHPPLFGERVDLLGVLNTYPQTSTALHRFTGQLYLSELLCSVATESHMMLYLVQLIPENVLNSSLKVD